MPNIRTITNSFSGGEICPSLYGRVDLAPVKNGLALSKNFLHLPQGGVMTRGGTRYAGSILNSTQPTRIISFSFSASQTFVLELGAGYFRFWSLGAQLLIGNCTSWSNTQAYKPGWVVFYGGFNWNCLTANTNVVPVAGAYWAVAPSDASKTPYQVANSYAEADLFDIHYVQSGDIVTLVHPKYPPMELRRYGNLWWSFVPVSFASLILAPTSPACAATYAHAGYPNTQTYVITALDSNGLEESVASLNTTPVSNDLTISGNFNTITWATVSGATLYNVYKSISGAFGFVGQVTALQLIDNNITPDFTRTPPQHDYDYGSTSAMLFTTTGNYPSAVGYYEQRRWFAGTNNQPENLWGTQSGTQNNMNYSIPSQANDALRVAIAAQKANFISHLVTLLDMIALTASTEWRIFSDNGSALTPSTISIKAQAQNGASGVQPVIANNLAVYVAAVGGHLRTMSYSWQMNGYQSDDLSLMSKHLFDGYTIVDLAYSRSPYPVIWALSSTGVLLGCTYLPDQQVQAWHQHVTVNGFVESIATVTETDHDVLYLVVRRVINGATVRYIEYMDTRQWTAQSSAYCVDCGFTYTSLTGPITTISGITWLEGQTVNVLGDGAVNNQKVVTGGAITLDAAATVVQVGLPMTCQMGLPPASFQDQTFGFGHVKNINKIWARIVNSGAFKAGPSLAVLNAITLRDNQAPGTPPPLFSGEYQLTIMPDSNQDGMVYVQMSDPLPLEISYVAMEIAAGG